ncbi:unnamed protein product [Closterium sp. NIES-54]
MIGLARVGPREGGSVFAIAVAKTSSSSCKTRDVQQQQVWRLTAAALMGTGSSSWRSDVEQQQVQRLETFADAAAGSTGMRGDVEKQQAWRWAKTAGVVSSSNSMRGGVQELQGWRAAAADMAAGPGRGRERENAEEEEGGWGVGGGGGEGGLLAWGVLVSLLSLVSRLLRPCTPSRLTQVLPAVSFAIVPPSPVPVRLADPSGGPVLAPSSTVLPCLAVQSDLLLGLHLPSFSTNLVSTAALQDTMVTTTTPGDQRVSICTCTRTGRHLATFTRRPGSSLYTLTTEPPQVAASAQVSASGPVAPPCSCRLLSHQTLLWHHRFGHPSLPRLRGMHSRLLISGLPKSLPPLLPSPASPCLPCVEGWQRAAPKTPRR